MLGIAPCGRENFIEVLNHCDQISEIRRRVIGEIAVRPVGGGLVEVLDDGDKIVEVGEAVKVCVASQRVLHQNLIRRGSGCRVCVAVRISDGKKSGIARGCAAIEACAGPKTVEVSSGQMPKPDKSITEPIQAAPEPAGPSSNRQ